MSTQQKSALYVLAVGLTAIVAYLALLLWAGPKVAPAAFAVVALTALVPALFQESDVDERERHIAYRAGLAGGVAAYLFLVTVCMVVWWVHYLKDSSLVDVNLLPAIAMGAAVALMVVRSSAVLVLHRRDLDVGES